MVRLVSIAWCRWERGMRLPGQQHPGPVTDREFQAIVANAFGRQTAPATSVALGGGHINDTRLLTMADGRRWVLRVAPSEATAIAGPSWFTPYGLRREWAVVEAASALDQYLPVTVVHDFDHSLIDRDWVIQQVMPGVSLASIDDSLDPVARSAIWSDLGDFTRRLHANSSNRFGPPAWGPSFVRWSELVAWDAAGMVDDAGRFGLPVATFERLAELIGRFSELLDGVTTPALIHSDLWPPHVFVERDADSAYRLVGVIDLEFGRYADPLSEHLPPTFDWGNVPEDMRPPFMEGYGSFTLRPGDAIRSRIYLAVGLSWAATLAAYQGKPYDRVIDDLERVVCDVERR